MVIIHPKKGGTWKEVFVYKSLGIVEVYNILSHGRRFYRYAIGVDMLYAHCVINYASPGLWSIPQMQTTL